MNRFEEIVWGGLVADEATMGMKMIKRIPSMKSFRRSIVLCLSLTLFLSASAIKETAKADSGETRKWVWSEKFPKPSWFHWGKKYFPDKPVRGDIIVKALAFISD